MAIVPYGQQADPVFVTSPSGGIATEATLQAVLAALGGSAGLKWFVYGEALGVANGVGTTVLTYTVPAGKKLILAIAQASCTNRAEFVVAIDAATVAKRYTQVTLLATDFNFGSGLVAGIEVAAGSTVDLVITHNQPGTADMSATFIGELNTI